MGKKKVNRGSSKKSDGGTLDIKPPDAPTALGEDRGFSNKQTVRLNRWLQTVALGCTPLALSILIHYLMRRPAVDAFRPSELSVLTLVLCATVLIDMHESRLKKSIEWPDLSSSVVLVLVACVVAASIFYALSIEIGHARLAQSISLERLSRPSYGLTIWCVAVCTAIETWMAAEEQKQ